MSNCYLPGYEMHFVHAKHIGRTPWGWRDGIVRSSADGTHVIDYLHEDGSVTVWSSILDEIEVGTPVRLHEEYYALAVNGLWYNVRKDSPGLGYVPEPADPTVWMQDRPVAYVDLGRGVGIQVPRTGQSRDPRV